MKANTLLVLLFLLPIGVGCETAGTSRTGKKRCQGTDINGPQSVA